MTTVRPRCRKKNNSRVDWIFFRAQKRIKSASLFFPNRRRRPMRIGAHTVRSGLFVAPMAGITDRPFRRLARRFGAALAVCEMVSSRPELRESRKTRLRLDHTGETGPISVQIAGSDPAMLADAARDNVSLARISSTSTGLPGEEGRKFSRARPCWKTKHSLRDPRCGGQGGRECRHPQDPTGPAPHRRTPGSCPPRESAGCRFWLSTAVRAQRVPPAAPRNTVAS